MWSRQLVELSVEDQGAGALKVQVELSDYQWVNDKLNAPKSRPLLELLSWVVCAKVYLLHAKRPTNKLGYDGTKCNTIRIPLFSGRKIGWGVSSAKCTSSWRRLGECGLGRRRSNKNSWTGRVQINEEMKERFLKFRIISASEATLVRDWQRSLLQANLRDIAVIVKQSRDRDLIQEQLASQYS